MKDVLKQRFLDSGPTKYLKVCIFRKTLAMTISFLKTCLKLDSDSISGKKNWEKSLCFSDNCIWIRNYKFSHSGTGCFSSAVNVLTNTPMISNFNQGDIFQINPRRSYEKYDKSPLMLISQVFGTLYHVDCRRVFWNGAF